MITTTTSKLTTKYQTTIPQSVRQLLQLDAGDAIAFDISNETVYVRKARSVDLAFAQNLEGTLQEWNSKADQDAYREL